MPKFVLKFCVQEEGSETECETLGKGDNVDQLKREAADIATARGFASPLYWAHTMPNRKDRYSCQLSETESLEIARCADSDADRELPL
jgi:hypothetical protein